MTTPGTPSARDTATLGSAGELATLARILPHLPAADDAEVGPGDDCAVVRAPDGRFVITTDMMIEGPDFRRAWSTPHDLGRRAATSNLADVAAMGARPTALLVAIAAPAGTPVADLEALADGLREGCVLQAPGCGVVGGDLSVSDALVITVTATGDLEGRDPVLRSGARPGDVIAVAGALGMAAAGVRLLFDLATSAAPRGDLVPDAALARALRASHPAAVEAQLAPVAPLTAGVDAARAGATAMLDVSDGLLLDLGRMARASGVGIDLASAALADDARRVAAAHPSLPPAALDLVLTGGEDHALVAAFPAGAPLPGPFRPIGVVAAPTADGPAVTVDGATYAGPRTALGGWDPYADWDGAR
ncbi:thiamine-phosphate kinase [Clavibacter michiganensis]|uniref:Thiamine-monophosphate kinase n=3 Tax=Clavibacter michiganensis TaxID=28447 RepID=A0A0D5CHD5_9MICO|nr:thiamine-phosphate kinase [Clavibacter michiganensis]AJW78690.1 thiamine-monophosphate kinase [Clavibacter michiganensis subsp. insidiosus]AWG01133.1 thiamine-phosphate kinase [Clavibacter michiganensis subsp. insidiosus]OQJ61322.1 thiamine-phosphate kinase [Clavibacter michiganensis subsp. insidiosus]RMC84732.1 thiamine-phosphate kinase [Clavibacter michiganensis subsp. insidiosus]